MAFLGEGEVDTVARVAGYGIVVPVKRGDEVSKGVGHEATGYRDSVHYCCCQNLDQDLVSVERS